MRTKLLALLAFLAALGVPVIALAVGLPGMPGAAGAGGIAAPDALPAAVTTAIVAGGAMVDAGRVGGWLAVLSAVLVAALRFLPTPGGQAILEGLGSKGKRIATGAIGLGAALLAGFASHSLTSVETIALCVLAPFCLIGTYELGPNGLLKRKAGGTAPADLVADTVADIASKHTLEVNVDAVAAHVALDALAAKLDTVKAKAEAAVAAVGAAAPPASPAP